MQVITTSANASTWKIKPIINYLLLVIGGLLVWFMPALHASWQKLDFSVYALLNQSLQYSRAWQLFWGYLNHPHETWINVVVMVAINILGIFSIPKEKRPRAFATVIYCWIFFQIVLLFTQKVLINGLYLHRHSPSMVHNPWVVLSQTLDINNIKVFSNSCFPAGHVLVLVFWAKFIALYANPQIKRLALCTVFLFTLPRLFSGAHWLSDILFTILYALLWFKIATGTPLYNSMLNFMQKLFAFRTRTRDRYNEKCLY